MLSEGAGLLVFEELEHAKRRGAKIYGEVLGYGVSADGGHITQPDEQGTGAARAMQNALRDAQLEPDDDRLHQCPRHEHAAGRPGRDRGHQERLRRPRAQASASPAPRASSATCWAPAAASSWCSLVLALRDSVIPPTINLDSPDPGCDLDYTPNQPRERRFDVAMSNSFGFGGHNASVIVGQVR